MALAAEVDMADLRLGLENRAHQVRERRVELHDLLELVQDQDGAASALVRDLLR